MRPRLALLVLATAACTSRVRINTVDGPVGAASGAASSATTGTVIVANMGDNTATLLDVASKRVVATLPTGNGAHEVAVSHDGRWAVVSNYGVRGTPGNSLTVIDVPAASVARTIDLGDFKRPHGSAFLPGDSVFVVSDMKDDKGRTYRGVRQQIVKVGPARGDQIAVLSGIKAGEAVVTSGLFKLRNGAAVQVNNKVKPGNNSAPKPENS